MEEVVGDPDQVQSCHGSTAAQHVGGKNADYELIARMKQNYEATAISSDNVLLGDSTPVADICRSLDHCRRSLLGAESLHSATGKPHRTF